jgi:hypothetical protein
MTGYFKVISTGHDLHGHECRRGGARSGAPVPPERRLCSWVYPYGGARQRLAAQAQALAQQALVQGSRAEEVRCG